MSNLAQNRVYQQNLARLRMQGADNMALDAAGVQTGGIYLESELSKLDPTIRMPLENHTWFRDIPVTYGGGWAENEIARNVDFAGPAESESGTDSNDIAVISYATNQDVWPIFPYQKRIRIPLVESLRMAQVNRSPQDLLDKGVRLDWNKLLDRRTYIGRKVGNTVVNPGLIGNPNVTSTQLPATGTGNSSLWANKTPQQKFDDFNFMVNTMWAATGYSPAGLPNRFLIPSDDYAQLLSPMTLGGVAVADSIVDWIEKRSYGVALGSAPKLYPLPGPWIDGTGVGGTNQIIAYKFDQDCLSLNIAQDLSRFGGPLSIQAGAFEATYLGNVGIVKINRYQTIGYFYGQK